MNTEEKNKEYEIEDPRFTRDRCVECKHKLIPCAKITDEGVVGKKPLAWICTNESCSRVADLDATGWLDVG